MFTVSVQLKAGIKSAMATGPRRALGQMTDFRDRYGVEPVVSDGERAYTEGELVELIASLRRSGILSGSASH